MAKLGFLGLGLMGYPMARNLLRAGHEVALWSHTTDKARKLASEEKGQFCDTPKQVAENADVIFLCVGDTEMAKTVMLGPDGSDRGSSFRRGCGGRQHHQPQREPQNRGCLPFQGCRIPRHSVHRLNTRRRERKLNLYDRRRPSRLRARSSPTSSRWGKSSSIAAVRGWAYRPS